MTGAERKRRWRQDPRNRQAENERRTTRSRGSAQQRLVESVRDTIRHINSKDQP